ncbi:hypothetical protein [Granulicoccus phenolivorans]|uniref:hypothetical protein n=1 Tax=Granulicoccus phenolivorans TaxID=266854 RepID=UPI000409052C|nr:hypothetical protein [Granulicoccus phenolivorans]
MATDYFRELALDPRLSDAQLAEQMQLLLRYAGSPDPAQRHRAQLADEALDLLRHHGRAALAGPSGQPVGQPGGQPDGGRPVMRPALPNSSVGMGIDRGERTMEPVPPLVRAEDLLAPEKPYSQASAVPPPSPARVAPGPMAPAYAAPATHTVAPAAVPSAGPPAYAPPPVEVDLTASGRLFSNLNLNGPAAARVRPRIGEWGPQEVPSTRAKRRMRWLVPVVFGVLAVVVALSMYWFYSVLLGKPFFGM